MKRFRKSEGFTLIELLIVIIIIGILAAIAIPMFLNQRDKAKESAVKEGVHSIQVGVQSYAVDNNDVYPAAADVSTVQRVASYVDNWPKNPWTERRHGYNAAPPRATTPTRAPATDAFTLAGLRQGSRRSSPSRDLTLPEQHQRDARGGCARSRPGRLSVALGARGRTAAAHELDEGLAAVRRIR